MISSIKQIIPTILLGIIVSFLPINSLMVDAQIETIDSGTSDDIGIADGKLVDFIVNVVDMFLALVAIIAVIFLIIGGFQYMTAAGDTSQAEKAKKTVMYAIIGLIVVGLSWAIIDFVIGAVGGGVDAQDD